MSHLPKFVSVAMYNEACAAHAALEAENAALREGLTTSQRQYCELEIALAVTHHGNGKLRERLAAAESRTVLTDAQIRTMARVYSYRAWGIEQVVEYTRAILAASAAPAAQEDAKRLDFMIQQEAWIAWTKDGESCRVFHLDDDGDGAPIMGWNNLAAWHHDARPAIDAAIAANTPKGTLE